MKKSSIDETLELDAPAAVIKRTFNLPLESVTAVKRLAAARGTSITEVVRRAIWIEQYLHDEIANGGRVYVKFPDETVKELVIR